MILKKILKWLKYIGIFLFVITIIGGIWMNREGKRMYGALTERVGHEQFKPKEGSFLIKNVNILSPNGDSIIPKQTILIEDGLITAIDSTVITSSNIYSIDGLGKYLIPGLIDTHAHLFQSPNDLLLYIANGVTEIRELIGEEDHLKWRDEIEKGRIGPKMFVATPRLGSFDSKEGWFMSYTQGYANIKNAEEAKEMIQEFHDMGYDGVKIYSQINKESYKAIIETANSLDMPVFGHIPWALELSDIWENNQSGIAHFEELMNALGREFNSDRMIGGFKGKDEEFLEFVEERSDELANNLIKNDIAVTSTLWLTSSFLEQPFNIDQVLGNVELEYENPGISEWVSWIPRGLGWLPNVNRYKLPENLTPEQTTKQMKYWDTYVKATQLVAHNMVKRGVKIMTGTDTNLPPTVPGFSLHDEFKSLNNAGMSSVEILKSATTIPAVWLKSNSGKIATGYEANLVLLDKNPLENISNTKTINTVINRGRIFNRELLNKMLVAVKDANDSSRTVDISKYKN